MEGTAGLIIKELLMLTKEALNEFGANTEEGLKRCFGNEEFYLKMVRSLTKEATFTKLNDAIAAGDLQAGFEAAHALKGVLSNLSMTPILTPVTEMTELLRNHTDMDYSGLLSQVNEKRAALEKLCD